MVKLLKVKTLKSGRYLYEFLIDGVRHDIVGDNLDEAHKKASAIEVENAK